MRNTPRTNAFVTGNSEATQDEYIELAEFCRTLEEEAAAFKKHADQLASALEDSLEWVGVSEAPNWVHRDGVGSLMRYWKREPVLDKLIADDEKDKRISALKKCHSFITDRNCPVSMDEILAVFRDLGLEPASEEVYYNNGGHI